MTDLDVTQVGLILASWSILGTLVALVLHSLFLDLLDWIKLALTRRARSASIGARDAL